MCYLSQTVGKIKDQDATNVEIIRIGLFCVLKLVTILLQADLVDQNLLNFLPLGEHSDVYKALSTHPSDTENLNSDYLKSQLYLLT